MFDKKFFFKEIFEYVKKKKEIPPVDLHVHTSWTDGRNTVDEMSETAIKLKLTNILFSEHSRKESKDWFNKFSNQVKSANIKFGKECNFLIGTEVKILNKKGELDLSDKIKKECDLIMASVHRFPGEEGSIINNQGKFSKEEALVLEYELMLAAIENSDADIIGHPFGMTLKRFNSEPPWELFLKIIKKAGQYEKIFEVNFHYHKNHKELVNACIENNTLVSFGSNAHSTDELGEVNKIKL